MNQESEDRKVAELVTLVHRNGWTVRVVKGGDFRVSVVPMLWQIVYLTIGFAAGYWCK